MPNYIYEFTETKETIEVNQKITEKAHEYLLHPEQMKLLPVTRLISGGCGIIFKGDGWTVPGNIPNSQGVKFPKQNEIDESQIKNKEMRSAPKKADKASGKKLEESRKFSNWLENGGGAEQIEKNSKKV